MVTPQPSLPAAALLTDYEHWLSFVTTSRAVVRNYDRQLSQLGKKHTDLNVLSQYLRECMHQRSQFFGELAIILTGKVAELRADSANEALCRKLTQAHVTMQTLIEQLANSFDDIEKSYRSLAGATFFSPKKASCKEV